ncbi:MAG: translocation/assembly module TamB domain-containing protein [Saprospiraceae bacterium]
MKEQNQISKDKRLLFRILIILKRLGQSFALILLLLFIAFILINTSQFLNWSKTKIIALLENQIENKIEYSSLEFNFFNGLNITDLVLYDHHDDTLIYGKRINISFSKNLLSLFKSELSLKDIEIDGGKLNIVKYEAESQDNFQKFLKQFESKSQTKESKFVFNLKQLLLKDFELTKFDRNNNNKQYFATKSARISVHSMNFKAKFLDIEEIYLENPSAQISTSNDTIVRANLEKNIQRDSICVDPFEILCQKLEIEGGMISYNGMNNDSTIARNVGFNPKFFSISDINLNLQQFNLVGSEFKSSSLKADGKINNEFDINSIQFNNIKFEKNELVVNKFKLFTEDSHLGDSIFIKFGEDTDIKNLMNQAYAQVLIRDTRISVKDILYFLPALRKNTYLANNQELQAELAGQFNGRLNNLKAFDLVVDIPNKLEFKGDVFTRDLTLKGEELLNINIKYLVSSSGFIQALVPTLSKVQIFNKIGRFRYTGRFDGYLEDFVSYGTFNSELGRIVSDIRLNLRPGVNSATWSGTVEMDKVNLGAMVQSDNFGKVSMKANIQNGVGLHLDQMTADFKADIYNLEFKEYNYQNIKLNARINKNLFDGVAIIKDKNLDLIFKGKISEIGTTPKFDFSADISKADLKALKLFNKSYIVSAKLESEFTNLDPDKLTGNILIKNGLIYDYENNRVVSLGDIQIHQSRTDENVNTLINSEILDFKASGNYKLKSVYNQVLSFLNQQYPDILTDFGLNFKEDLNPIDINSEFEIKSINRISNFFDWAFKSDVIKGNLNIHSGTNVLNSSINGTKVIFKDIKLDNFSGTLDGDSSQLNGKFLINSVSMNEKLILRNVKLFQNFSNSIMHFNFMARDTLDTKNLYSINVGSIKSGKNKKFYFEGKDILINGFSLSYGKEALFEIGKNYISLDNFYLYDSSSEIRISDINHQGINVSAKSFDLAVINPILKSQSLNFSGRYDFGLMIDNIFQIKEINGEIDLLNLRINNMSYGRFAINFNTDDPTKPLNIEIKNSYKETNIDLKGSINFPLTGNYTLPKYDFSLSGYVRGFELYFLESFIASISNTSGTLSGPMRIYRENKKLFIDGDFISSNSSSKVNYLNTNYKFDKQKVKFEKNIIYFNNVTVNDELNNTIQVNGKISHDNLAYFTMDIALNSRRALILNTTKENNIYYYGYGIMSFQCTFKGLTNKMDMDFNGRSERGSRFVIPVRYDQESKDTKFVKFKSKDNVVAASIQNAVLIKGMNIKMDVELNEDCEMSILFDEKNGDILKGNGHGNIQVANLRDNSFTIKGNYEINTGQYLFTLFNFVNKPFKLKKGGSIVWTGDPLNADIYIEASYEGLNISPYNLIEEYLTANQVEKDRAKERTQVDLSMIMQGSLLKPDISFKLGLPELTGSLRNWADAKIKILEQNPEEINQQVASLIIFRTFIGTGSKLDNISTVQNTGINTFSEFLSNQISIFASNLLAEAYDKVGIVSGVDVNVNYNPNTIVVGSEQTNASEVVFNIKHHLWNDEWAVSIGGNYGNNSPFNQTSYFNPESIIEWNTPVPGLKMRMYYKGVEGVDGVRHRLGTGVTYRKEFNSLKELKIGLKEQLTGNGNGK